MFLHGLSWHRHTLKMNDREMNIVDEEALCKRYPASRSVLLGRGYKELQNEVRALYPIMRLPETLFTNQQRNYNSKIPCDRVIVER